MKVSVLSLKEMATQHWFSYSTFKLPASTKNILWLTR